MDVRDLGYELPRIPIPRNPVNMDEMRKCLTLVKSTEVRGKDGGSPELEALLGSGLSLFRFYLVLSPTPNQP
jgi:hypothetical protein